jgi:Rps23 Pro-64 3,4-dihydroxylase Tpa1-like proline 4-hydroxylase|tara:strand:+ start:218 stop:937 length:720 start_codon:yes stop_codon:yes gene_type:complete
MFINYEIDKNDQDFYQNNDYVVLENFFDSTTIEQLYNTINSAPDNWWNASTLDSKTDSPFILSYTDNNYMNIKINKKISLINFASGKFCYRFDRLRSDHYKNCNCNVCKFDKLLHSNELLEFCKKFTENNEIGLIELQPFYSRYRSKDFLSLHTDYVTTLNGFSRKIAVVIHLTKNWQPWYGGNLTLLEKNSTDIKKTLVPKFNSIILMKVENQGVPHYVTPVINNLLGKNRYAISMWF